MRLKNYPLFIALLLGIAACTEIKSSHPIERKHYDKGEVDIGYSQVVRKGKTLYISGVVSTAPTFAQQLKEEYEFITKILADYGVDTGAIVKETIFTRDMEALKRVIPERKAFFKTDMYPSASWIQVAQLYDPAIMLEIEVEAHLP